jgi:hypothetical protein
MSYFPLNYRLEAPSLQGFSGGIENLFSASFLKREIVIPWCKTVAATTFFIELSSYYLAV